MDPRPPLPFSHPVSTAVRWNSNKRGDLSQNGLSQNGYGVLLLLLLLMMMMMMLLMVDETQVFIHRPGAESPGSETPGDSGTPGALDDEQLFVVEGSKNFAGKTRTANECLRDAVKLWKIASEASTVHTSSSCDAVTTRTGRDGPQDPRVPSHVESVKFCKRPQTDAEHVSTVEPSVARRPPCRCTATGASTTKPKTEPEISTVCCTVWHCAYPSLHTTGKSTTLSLN